MYGIGFQEIFLFFIFFIIPAIVGYKFAETKNRNATLWAFICFFIPPALIILVFLGQVSKDTVKRVPCPYCRELIVEGATI